VGASLEQLGIESIPDRDRTATLFDFMRIEWGGLNSLATAVLGAFPIIFGLSFWQSVAATTLGVVLGRWCSRRWAVWTAHRTNNAVSSSAHFGVVDASWLLPEPLDRGGVLLDQRLGER